MRMEEVIAYLITYDLRAPVRDYAGLYEAFEKTGVYWHAFQSVWIMDHPGPAKVIYNFLARHIDRNDRIMVIDCGNDWVAWGVDPGAAAWLQSCL